MNQAPNAPIPSLPAVIGSTENALRALLSQTLASTSIPDYAAWVVLNIIAANPQAPLRGWQGFAADALKVSDEEILAIATQLTELKLLDTNGSLSAAGSSELTIARTAVSASTARLVEDIDEEQQTATRSVLGEIRQRAEQSLTK